VDERDLEILAADLGARWVAVSELYDWYVAMINPEGRLPLTKKAFGLALKEAGWRSAVRRMGDESKPARCWLITLPWYRRGLELMAREKAASDH
jgi:hypothetical protein